MEAAGVEPAGDIAVNDAAATPCGICPACGAALALHGPVTALQQPAQPDAELQRLIAAWDALPAHLRAAITAIAASAG